jgi:hypothetical protein
MSATPPSTPQHGEPLPLMAEELRSIALDLEESDADAWRSRIVMLREMADDLAARSNGAEPQQHAVTQQMYEAGMKYLHGRGTAWCCTDLYLAMEAQRVKGETT